MTNRDQAGLSLTAQEMALYIDHTLLKPQAARADLNRLCQEALAHSFKAVCVNSGLVAAAAKRLQGSGVAVCSVVGFPLGAVQTRAKAFEAEAAAQDGATEIDMVLNLFWFKSGEEKKAEEDIREVRQALGPDRILKVIIETCLLSQEEKVLACKISKNAGADFVKTSTGFSTGGATLEDVALMRKTVGPEMGVKASGGIKDWERASAMIRAGASRIGTSSGVEILKGASD